MFPVTITENLGHAKGFFKRIFCELAFGGRGLERGVGEGGWREGFGRGWGRDGEALGKGWGGLGFFTSEPRLKKPINVP